MNFIFYMISSDVNILKTFHNLKCVNLIEIDMKKLMTGTMKIVLKNTKCVLIIKDAAAAKMEKRSM